jgi:hypothetical protein
MLRIPDDGGRPAFRTDPVSRQSNLITLRPIQRV